MSLRISLSINGCFFLPFPQTFINFFFLNDTPPPEISPLPLHDALPISSDPRYLGHEPIEQPVQAVYRIDPEGAIQRIITDAGKPNGLCLAPDQKTLYVIVNDNGSTGIDRKSTRLNSSHTQISYAVFCFQ